MASRHQRTELTIGDKLDIIKSLKNNKCSRKDLEERYKVSQHTIKRILSREDQLKNTKNCKLRRIRSGNNRQIDDAVSKWYRSMQEQNIFVNGPLLRKQAVIFARMLNNHTFEANNGWLWRWQQKENVKFNASNLGRKAGAPAKADNKANKERDAIEFDESTSVRGVSDSNTNVDWHPMPNQLQQSEISHFKIKEEAHDLHRNPFETDVAFEIESDEQEASQNNYPAECLITDREEVRNDQEKVSLDYVSCLDNNFYQQPVAIKEELNNDYRINYFEEDPEKYRLKKENRTIENDSQDIYSIYGDYIARRLRASANERENYEIYIAQHNIDDIIFKLSMGSYARVSSSRPNDDGSNTEQISQTHQSR